MPCAAGDRLRRRRLQLLAAPLRPVGLRDDARRPGGGTRSAPRATAPRTQACRRRRSAARRHHLPGLLQLLDLADDQVALDAAQPIDEHHAVEMIHLVLERAREQVPCLRSSARTPCAVEALTTARAGRTTVALKPGTLRQPSSSSCVPSRSTNAGLTIDDQLAGVAADR